MLFPSLESQCGKQILQALLVYFAAVHKDRQSDVFGHIQHRNQIVELVDQAYLTPAEDGQLVLILSKDILTFQKHFASCGTIHASQNVQQRGFAGTGRTDDGNKLPLLDREGYIVQGTDFILTFAIDLGKVFNA